MKLFRLTLLLLLLSSLSSCVSRPTQLVPGSSVTFVNRIEPNFSLYLPEGLFRTPIKTPIPNGNVIMKTIVMDEAAKAGVRCIYKVEPYQFKVSFGMADQEVKEAKEFAAAAATPVTLVLTPSLLSGNYDANSSGGFVLNQAKSLVGRTLTISFSSSDIRVDTSSGKQTPSVRIFGLNKTYEGFAGGLNWDKASPVSRDRAIQVMTTLFRIKVAELFSNPPPAIPAEIRDQTTHL